LRKTVEDLQAFETRIGLPFNSVDDHEEFKTYLHMGVNELEKLQYADCANIGYRLVQFSIYIQRCLNLEKSKARMLGHRINKAIAPNIGQYKGSWEMNRYRAIANDDAVSQLQEILIKIEQRIDALEFVSGGIKALSDHIKNVQFTKRKQAESQEY
jgi:hypothetical protein